MSLPNAARDTARIKGLGFIEDRYKRSRPTGHVTEAALRKTFRMLLPSRDRIEFDKFIRSLKAKRARPVRRRA